LYISSKKLNLENTGVGKDKIDCSTIVIDCTQTEADAADMWLKKQVLLLTRPGSIDMSQLRDGEWIDDCMVDLVSIHLSTSEAAHARGIMFLSCYWFVTDAKSVFP
jgi:hypothetical protein